MTQEQLAKELYADLVSNKPISTLINRENFTDNNNLSVKGLTDAQELINKVKCRSVLCSHHLRGTLEIKLNDGPNNSFFNFGKIYIYPMHSFKDLDLILVPDKYLSGLNLDEVDGTAKQLRRHTPWSLEKIIKISITIVRARKAGEYNDTRTMDTI